MIQQVFKSEKRDSWLIFSLVGLIALIFALYTRHAWEDYYITYRPAKNLALGHGLVFTLGQRVHTFTSPLNALIPAFLSYITRNHSDALVLWLYRLISCLALGMTAVLLFQIIRRGRHSLEIFAGVMLLAMFGVDAKILDFSINGQEAAFLLVFHALTLHALFVPSRRAVWQ